jgi:hypothetical protein
MTEGLCSCAPRAPATKSAMRFVTALQILLSGVIPLAATIEVEHPPRVGGAFAVPLHDWVPAAAMRTPNQITNSEWSIHGRSMSKLRDNAGQCESLVLRVSRLTMNRSSRTSSVPLRLPPRS